MSEENGLPNGWVRTTLGEVFEWGSGGTPQSTNVDYYGGSIPWVIIGDLNDGVVTTSQSTLTETGLSNSSAKWVEPGSVLIAMYGASIGKLGIAGIPLTTNQAIAFTSPHPVESKYLFYYLLRQKDELINLGKGAAQKNISQAVIKAFPFTLAPLAEQQRIVAAIEQQFTRLDAGAAALKSAQTRLKRYRAAVLKAAVEGKLTEAWRAEYPETEPAKASRERILNLVRESSGQVKDKRRLWGAGHVADVSEDIRSALPKSWDFCKVRDLGPDPTSVVQVGPMSMQSRDFAPEGVPVLNVGCIKWGYFDLSKLDYLPPAIAVSFERYRIKAGDVIFTRSGTVGRCAVAGKDQDDWLMTFHLLRVRVDPRICLPSYLTYVFEGAEHVRAQIAGASIGSTRAGFNTRLLEELDIPLPPLAEQEQIVAEVEQRLSVVSEIEATVGANLKRAERLRQSILREAFAGRLVPQDPNDEPASVLLERIRRERGSNGRTTKQDKEREAVLIEARPVEQVEARTVSLWDEKE